MADNGAQFVAWLDSYEREWNAGVYRAVLDAFELCVGNDLAFPSWLSDAVMDDLLFAYRSRRRGAKMARTGEKQDLKRYRKAARLQIMKSLIDWQQVEIDAGLREGPLNRKEAARDAEKILAGSDARGSTRSIRDNFRDKGE